MAAPPLLSVARYGAFFTGYAYGALNLQYLKGKDAKYQADQQARAAATASAPKTEVHHH